MSSPSSRPQPAQVVVYEGDERTPWRAEVYDSAGSLRSRLPAAGVGDPKYYTRERIEKFIEDFFPGLPVNVIAIDDQVRRNGSEARVKRKSEKRHALEFSGYQFTAGPQGTTIHREALPSREIGRDYGADPLGDGRFRMVPSGDIVDFDERVRRLRKNSGGGEEDRVTWVPVKLKPDPKVPARYRVPGGWYCFDTRTLSADVVGWRPFSSKKEAETECEKRNRKESSGSEAGLRRNPEGRDRSHLKAWEVDVHHPAGRRSSYFDTEEEAQRIALSHQRAGWTASVSKSGPHSANPGYYVWILDPRTKEPISGEGPYGPYDDLTAAKTFARIGAQQGKHPRAVSRGADPSSSSFEVVRVY